MAAGEIVIESVVNRWIVDYHGFRALEFFRRNQYDEFCSVRDILHTVLDRPVQSTNATKTKIQVLQFLSRINDGDNLEKSFETDESVSPLESALMILENWQKCSTPHEGLPFEKVCSSVKEMMVGILIRKCKFDRAEEMLKKHFPKPMVGKKATFMSLIRQKQNKHRIIEQMDFHQFKLEMLSFCQKLCTFDVPFLHKVANEAFNKSQQNDRAAPEEEESSHSSSPQPVSWKLTVIQKNRLKAAYKAMVNSSEEKSFAQLEEEVEREGQARKEDFMCLSHTHKQLTTQENVTEEETLQKESGSPIEASPADEPSQTDADLQTQGGTLSNTPSVAQLVIQPDSQVSLKCSIAPRELQIEVRTEEVAESPIKSSKPDLQCPVTENEIPKPTRRIPRRLDKTHSRASASCPELTEDSEEDHDASVSNEENESHSTPNRNSTKSKRSLLDFEEDPNEGSSTFRSPVQKRCKQRATNPLSKDSCNADNIAITDSSLDSSPSPPRLHAVPQTSSTPQNVSTQDKGRTLKKWNQLFREAKESKETWSDSESNDSIKVNNGLDESTVSNSGSRKRKWTKTETEMLKEGVKRFGEGSWKEILSAYKFNNRTNVNLKDRWRTMKNSNMV
ncbi:telomeric repeat binding factor a [Betta splendens]|uniref:Telomeric repeat binding factor a n=1 Tax=Betta splendens TaxID=158456 RepID=A0A6P7M2P8_BETSP|nr:telomeric repeat binding factor a [Betta splendens]